MSSAVNSDLPLIVMFAVSHVLHPFNHAGDDLELLVHTSDLDLRDGETFQRGEEDAAEGVADGLSVAGLKRPELETTHGLGAFEHDHLVGLLNC